MVAQSDKVLNFNKNAVANQRKFGKVVGEFLRLFGVASVNRRNRCEHDIVLFFGAKVNGGLKMRYQFDTFN
jgi:hypothetical protein